MCRLTKRTRSGKLEDILQEINRYLIGWMGYYRLAETPSVYAGLDSWIGRRVCEKDFNAIVSQAMTLLWTRDPFDRVIVANAALNDNILISKDQNILAHYAHAR